MLSPSEQEAINKSMNNFEDSILELSNFHKRVSVVDFAIRTIFTLKLNFSWKKEILRQLKEMWRAVGYEAKE